MKIKYLPLIIAATFFCRQLIGQNADYKTSASGLKYIIVNNGSAEKPKAGDRIWVEYTGKLTNDSVFASTKETGNADFYMGQGQIIKGWEEALTMIGEGGEIKLIVPPALGYGTMKIPGIPSNSTLLFEIKLLQVDKGTPIEPFNTSGLSALKGSKGIKYYEISRGSGPKAKPNDNAYVHYTGWLPDGTIFTSSLKVSDGIRITVGAGEVIEGWDLLLPLMAQGSKIRAEIAPELAFGKEGYGNRVPPGSKIILDLEMVKLSPEVHVSKWDAKNLDTITTASGLRYIVFDTGIGGLIQPNTIITVHYSTYTSDGKLLESSVKREEPLKFPAGAGLVIEGWDEASLLMRLGAKYQLIVPARLAYGTEGSLPEIAPNTDLIFDIEVLEVMQ